MKAHVPCIGQFLVLHRCFLNKAAADCVAGRLLMDTSSTMIQHCVFFCLLKLVC